MKPSRIHHAQITVTPQEVDAARTFYCNVLGLPEVEKPDALKPNGGFWLAVGDAQVHVGVEDKAGHSPTKAHVAYQVKDLGAWRERLAEHGIEVQESTPIPGHDRFEFRDPFGNRVEMIEPQASARQAVFSGSPWEGHVGYARAVRVGNVISVSGTTASDTEGDVIGSTAADQTRYILVKIEQALAELGASLDDVVRTRMFVVNINDWESIGAVHAAFFGDVRPSSTMVEVSRLIDPAHLIEIEVDAVLS